ncbi:neuropeptides capa receptor-like [Stylophora pistillata]|uniref:neuropeptides capa receptor-like n=1 Tax=Stylophora pistillata TaxID=50429 RepID=UPI000C042579|nr:neuropeptides capa receptor-like [Stylophora pistillata]
MNNTSQCIGDVNIEGESTIKILVYSAIALVSLLGNSLLILVFFRSNSVKKATNVFIISMAASDLFFPVFLIPRLIIQTVTGLSQNVFLIHGAMGSFLCKISNFFTDMSIAVSTHSLVMITMERFLAIVFPFRIRQLSSKARLYAILMVWIIAMGIHSPYFYTYRLTSSGSCSHNWEPAFNHEITHTRFYTAQFVVVVILPFTLITVLYSVMVCCLFLNKDKLIIHRPSKDASKRRSEAKELRMLKIAATIVIAFALCWGPFNIIQFFHLFAPRKLENIDCKIKHMLSQVALMMATANCTVNPIVCLVYLRNYRLQESLASLRSQFSNISKGSQRETEL